MTTPAPSGPPSPVSQRSPVVQRSQLPPTKPPKKKKETTRILPEANITSVVKAVGVKRPGFGKDGVKIKVLTNHFPIRLREGMIVHYDGSSPFPPYFRCLTAFQWVRARLLRSRALSSFVFSDISPSLAPRMNYHLINKLQTQIAQNIFTPQCAYDGKKNLFSIHTLQLEHGNTQTVGFTDVQYNNR